MNPETRQRINRLLAAQARILSDWAEAEPGSDDRREMWRELHDAGDALREVLELETERA